MSSGKFKELKAYLQALPEALPLSSPTSKLNKLLDFSLDEDWLNDVPVGVKRAVNREIEAYGRRDFDLALQFDIQRYIDILADNASNCTGKRTSENREPQTLLTKLKDTSADTLAPRDDEWGRWE
jgi:hypothetical protein